MITALGIFALLFLLYFGGVTATYVTCYLRYGGKPEDRVMVYEGWKGGDAGIMLIFWPITLIYQGVSLTGNLIGHLVDSRLRGKLSVSTKKAELRSGQQSGLYD